MTYKVYIRDLDTHAPIAGAVYFYDDSLNEVGQAVIADTGSSFDMVGTKVVVSAPGYSPYGYLNADQLTDESTFYLARHKTNWLPVLAAGAGLFLYFKIFR